MPENQGSENTVNRILDLLRSTELSEDDAHTIALYATRRVRHVEPDEEHDVHGIKRGVISPSPPGVPGKDLLRFAGSVPDDDLNQMEHAIEERWT